MKHKANFDQLAYALYIVDPSKEGLVLRGDGNNLIQTAPKTVDGLKEVPYLMQQFMGRKEPTVDFLSTYTEDEDAAISVGFTPTPLWLSELRSSPYICVDKYYCRSV